MKFKDKDILINKNDYILHQLVLIAILFSASAFHSEANTNYYIYTILMVCFLTFFYLLFKLKKTTPIINYKFLCWTLIFWVYLFIYGLLLPGLVHPVYSDFNTDYRIFTLVVILCVYIWSSYIPLHKAIDILIKSTAITSIVLCSYIFINERELIMAGGIRIGESASGNVNTVGLYLGIFFILCFYKILYEKAYLYLPVSLLQVTFMMLTGSKKTLVFVIFGVFIMYLIKEKLKVYKYIVPISLIAIIVFIAINNDFLHDIIGFRIIDFIGQLGFEVEGANYSRSTDLRKQMVFIGLDAFMQSPLWGNGWFYFSAFSGLNTYSHNNYIELLVSHGIFGFFLYYSMYIFILYKLYKMLNSGGYAVLFFTLVSALMFIDIAAVTYYDSPRNYIILFFAYRIVKEMDIQRLKNS